MLTSAPMQTHPTSPAELLPAALRLHQDGQLREAAAIYEQILSCHPTHPDALHLLGLVAFQLGRFQQAINLIKRAIAVIPSVAGYHCNCGEAWRRLGKLDEAIHCHREALRLNPDYLEAHINLGSAFKQNGKLAEAAACYRRALQINPNHFGLHNNLGNLLKEMGQLDPAVVSYQEALRLKPDFAPTHVNLGLAWQEQNRLEEAIASFRRALPLAPQDAETHFKLGNALQKQGCAAEAIPCFAKAIELQPSYADARINLALALQEENQIGPALRHLWEAVHVQPDYPDAHWNLALALLLSGDFRNGWNEYEWRWRYPRFSSRPRQFSQPKWNGAVLAGRTILLHAEQGLGDTIQFIRYAPLVAERGGRVIVECQPGLVSLLKSAPGVEQVVARGQPLPHFDIYTPLMSLPRIFGTTLESIPAAIPYLSAPGSRRFQLGKPPHAKLKMGLVWAGGSLHQKDHLRSASLAHFAPLLEIQEIAFYSLQIGPRAADLASLPNRFAIADLSPRLHDFADTAAAISQLDLVISVDTAVAHLVGALGRPIWTLLPYAPDWRWLLERGDTPWYPSMRLFRQTLQGDWTGVITRVTGALQSRPGVRSEGRNLMSLSPGDLSACPAQAEERIGRELERVA